MRIYDTLSYWGLRRYICISLEVSITPGPLRLLVKHICLQNKANQKGPTPLRPNKDYTADGFIWRTIRLWNESKHVDNSTGDMLSSRKWSQQLDNEHYFSGRTSTAKNVEDLGLYNFHFPWAVCNSSPWAVVITLHVSLTLAGVKATRSLRGWKSNHFHPTEALSRESATFHRILLQQSLQFCSRLDWSPH